MGDLFGSSSTTTTVVQPSGPPPQPYQPPAPPDLSGLQAPEPVPMDPALTDYLHQAMAGTLPVPVAMENDLAAQKGVLIQALARTEGADWQTSTVGVQAMQTFEARAEAARDAARHGNAATTKSILDGLVQENAFANRAQLEAFQAQVSEGLAAYQAEVEASIAAYKAQYGNQGSTKETTTKSGGLGGVGALAGGVIGIGAASLLGGKDKPWWLGGKGDKKPEGAGSTEDPFAGWYQADFQDLPSSSDIRYDYKAPGLGDLSGTPGGLDFGNMFDPGFDMGSLGSLYSQPNLDFGNMFDPGFDMGSLYPQFNFDFGNMFDPGFDMGSLGSMGSYFPSSDFSFSGAY